MLDIEKAFDLIDWGYMYLGCGPLFIHWIDLLYWSPQASNNLDIWSLPLWWWGGAQVSDVPYLPQ